MNDGILKMIEQAPVVAYDPRCGIGLKELGDLMARLSNYKPRKPEYILSKQEAENLPLWQLNWLGENYTVLTSIEVADIVRERERQA